MVKEADLYLPMLQPLQYAKNWKKKPKGYIGISDLRSCLQKDCAHRPGKFDSLYRETIISCKLILEITAIFVNQV